LLQYEKPAKPFGGILRALRPNVTHLCATTIEQMKPPKRRNQIGRLEIFCSAAALLLAIGSIVGAWTLNLLIALVLLAVVYSVLCDLRALKELKKPVAAQHTSGKSHAERIERAAG
jgi:hypothetical protein